MLTEKSQTTNWLFTFYERLQSKKVHNYMHPNTHTKKILIACDEMSFLPGILKCKKSKILRKDTTPKFLVIYSTPFPKELYPLACILMI